MARRILLILIALIVSGGGLFIAQQWLRGPANKTTAHPDAPPPPPQVLVAKGDLYEGQFIRPDEVAWQAWAPGTVPDTYIVASRARISDLVGSVVRSRIAAGQPVTLGQVVRPGDRGFLAAVLTPGSRAVTVNVTPSSGDAGFAFPGDRVDLLLTMTVQPSGAGGAGVARHVSETILRNVRLVGMDQSFTDGRKDEKADLAVPKTATLEVTPKQAEMVAVATDLGVMSLSLRSLATPGDSVPPTRVSKTWDVEVTQIATAARAAARPPPPPPPPWTVEIVHGSATSQASGPQPSAPAAASPARP
jgi:pilus assembly protein CpaB